jgi:hypothetical protein
MFDKSKVRIHYVRDLATVRPKLPTTEEKRDIATRGVPVGCIATFVDKEKDVIYFQYAISHPKDCFIKQRAVEIASGRLENKPWEVSGVPTSKHEIYAKVVATIVRNTEFLANVRSATRDQMEKAKKWHISAAFHKHAANWLEEYNKMQQFKEMAYPKITDTNIFGSAVTEAIATHHREGREVVVERDGKIVRLAPPTSK